MTKRNISSMGLAPAIPILMETKPSRSVVFIHVNLPVAVNARPLLNDPRCAPFFVDADMFSRDLDKLFFNDKTQGHFVKIGEGAFLADEDAWYPHILAMTRWCDEKKFPYLIVPIGGASTTFSGENPDALRWLVDKGKRTRATRPVLAQGSQ